MKRFNIVTFISILTMLVMSTTVDAKSSSFGGRSSSSFSSSRSSFGSSKSSSSSSFFSSSKSSSSPSRSFSFGGNSSSSSKPSSAPSSTRGLFSFSGNSTTKKAVGAGIAIGAVGTAASAPSTSVNINRDNSVSSINSKGATGNSASQMFDKFKQTNTPSSTVKIPNTSRPTYSSYNRRTYYNGYKPTYSPRYRETVYVNHSNGYGIWDLMMFNAIMDNHGDRQMYYHHQNDQAFRDWRTDADKACVAGDVDVCTKLKDLDREMAEYKAKGVQPNTNYITPGVDPSVYKTTPVKPVSADDSDDSENLSTVGLLLWWIGVGLVLISCGIYCFAIRRGR